MRALLYLRQSEKRRGETEANSLSLDAQEAMLRERGDRDGWSIAGVIRDHDRKGDDPVRPGLLDLKRRAANREADLIAVLNMSRFARDNVIQELTFRELRAWGVGVVSLLEPNIDHTLMRGVVGVLNQYHREQLGQAIAGVIRQRARQGGTFGQVAYGFRRVADDSAGGRPIHRLVAYEPEARVVLLIYERFADGWSIADLRRWLAVDATVPPRPRGGPWSGNALWFVLRLEVYTGVVAVKGEKPAGKLLADVRVEGAHEPIVPRELWDRVQRRLADSRPRIRDKKEHHWLEGHVYCVGCGENMYFILRERPGKTHKDRQWVCRGATMFRNGQRSEPCPAAKAAAGYRWVGRAVDRAIVRILSRAATLHDDDLRRHLAKPDDRADRIAARLRQAERERDNLVASLKHGAPASVIGPEIAALTDRIAALNRERATLAPVQTLGDLREMRAAVAEVAITWEMLPDADRRAWAERMALRVIVDSAARRVRITFGGEWAWLS